MGCRDTAKGQAALSTLQKEEIKGTLSLIQLDVEDDTSIPTAARTMSQDFGRVDVFISNAGTTSYNTTGSQKLERIFSTNVFGAMLVSEAFIPLLLKSARPYLVQVSSELGSVASAVDPQNAHYAAPWDEYRMSKAALNMMTIQLQKRLQGTGARVYAFCPGLVRSNLRGVSDAAVSANGAAGDPMDSARGICGIVLGERDGDAGRFVNKEGLLEW